MSLDWRWQRARYLNDSGRGLSRTQDDEKVSVVLEFLRARNSGKPEAMEILQSRFPYLYAAYSVYEDPSGWTRCNIEAALLCHSPEPTAEEIGYFLGLDYRTVIRYEEVFFSVKDFLYSPGWIIDNVVRPSELSAVTPLDKEAVVAKLLAYHYGWDVFTTWTKKTGLTQEVIDSVDQLIQRYVRGNMLSSQINRPMDRWTIDGASETYYNERKVSVAERYAIGGNEDRDVEEAVEGIRQAGEFHKLTENDRLPDSGIEPRAFELVPQNCKKEK